MVVNLYSLNNHTSFNLNKTQNIKFGDNSSKDKVGQLTAYNPSSHIEVQAYYDAKKEFSEGFKKLKPQTVEGIAQIVDDEIDFIKNYQQNRILPKNSEQKKAIIKNNAGLIKNKKQNREFYRKLDPEYDKLTEKHSLLLEDGIKKRNKASMCKVIAYLGAAQNATAPFLKNEPIKIIEPETRFKPKG